MEFNELKEDLLRRVKEKGASAEAYELFRAAETREELARAIADSFAWCYRRGAVDATYLTEKFGDLLEPFGVFTGEGSAATAATAIGSARVWANDSAKVTAFDSAEVWARGSAKVEAYGSAEVIARDEATVKLFDRATVFAYDDAYVENYTGRELSPLSDRAIVKDIRIEEAGGELSEEDKVKKSVNDPE